MPIVMANVAKIGKFSLKVLNSLVHTGPYLAVQIGAKRVAWVSFKTCKHTSYTGTESECRGIEEVERWLENDDNFNKAAAKWNNFLNGVNVPLRVTEEKK